MKNGLALLVATALLGLAACGDDDKDKKSGGAQTLSVSIDAQGKLQGVKDLEGGLVTIDFRNGAKVPYDFQLIRVDGNQPVAQVLRVITSDEPTPIPNWMHGAGGVGGTKPGAGGSSSQVLPAGTYYAIAQPDTEDDSKPVTAAFKVEGGESGGELPSTAATVTATEYEFAAEGLKVGSNRVRFVNDGKELHHVIAFQLKPGKTAADLKKAFTSEDQQGPPPFVEGTENGTAVLDGGTEQVADLVLTKPGKYALVCFIPDRKGGPPHAAKGMITEVDVQ